MQKKTVEAKPEPKSMLVDVSCVRTDMGTQFRLKTDMEIVADYQAKLEAGVDLGEIVVFHTPDGHYVCADGIKRTLAHIKANIANIPALIIEGTLDEAVEHALGANHAHGERRGYGDIRNAIMFMLNDPRWSELPTARGGVGKIAAIVHCNESTVRKVCDEAEARRSKNAPRGAVNPTEAPPEIHESTKLLMAYAPDLLEHINAGQLTVPAALDILEKRKAGQGDGATETVEPPKPEESVEDALTADEWLMKSPLYRWALQMNPQAAVDLRYEMLAWRAMDEFGMFGKVQYAASRSFDMKRGGDTNLTGMVVSLLAVPHPHEWLACVTCKGGGGNCGDCHGTIASLSGVGLKVPENF